jgi:hypothetical protein
MASTSYKARVIYKKHSEDGFAGTYKLMVAAKSISAPVSAPNTVETTTFEDDSQTFLMGIKTSDAKTYSGNLEKAYLQDLIAVEGEQIDIIQLYGSDGLGAVAKYAFVGQATATPNDVSGTDSVLEMTVTAVPNTSPVECTDKLTVVDNGDGSFTVTKAGE